VTPMATSSRWRAPRSIGPGPDLQNRATAITTLRLEGHGGGSAAGLEPGKPVWAAEAFGDPTLGKFAWFFVRAPDGRVFAIEQVPD
jgi:hypothetical protein